MSKLSVALATYNEEKNIGACLESVKDIASEIVIVDGSSIDDTVAIAKKYGAKIQVTDNPPLFHINKQKALEMAQYEWILQLDADERVTPNLEKEIQKVIQMTDEEREKYQKNLPGLALFSRHSALLEKRDGAIGKKEGKYHAFFIPRLNYFLGKYLRHGGVYPDGVIRLVRKGHAHFPCRDVHEQIAVDGRVGWLQNPLLHKDSPTFERYISRNNRYSDLLATQMKKDRVRKDFFTSVSYIIIKPLKVFLQIYFCHKGFLDGWQGLIWAFFSARTIEAAYKKYLIHP